MADKVKELSEPELIAVIEAILQITGSKNLTEFETNHPPTQQQWHEAYAIAGIPWEDYEEQHFIRGQMREATTMCAAERE